MCEFIFSYNNEFHIRCLPVHLPSPCFATGKKSLSLLLTCSFFQSKQHDSRFHHFLVGHLFIIITTVIIELCLCVLTLQARKAAILLLREGRPFSWLTHIISTLTILGVVLLMAIFVPDIRNVFGVVGM